MKKIFGIAIPLLILIKATLVHETTHVWQHQNGGDDYMIRELHAQ
ncbi:MAG: hypothetical protein ACR2LT_02255 [Pyrinomonadaceae bacterium]